MARNLPTAAVGMLLLFLFADYHCFDLRYVRAIRFASGLSAESLWYWPVFGTCLALILYGRVLDKVVAILHELRHHAVGQRATT